MKTTGHAHQARIETLIQDCLQDQKANNLHHHAYVNFSASELVLEKIPMERLHQRVREEIPQASMQTIVQDDWIMMQLGDNPLHDIEALKKILMEEIADNHWMLGMTAPNITLIAQKVPAAVAKKAKAEGSCRHTQVADNGHNFFFEGEGESLAPRLRRCLEILLDAPEAIVSFNTKTKTTRAWHREDIMQERLMAVAHGAKATTKLKT